MNGIDFLAIGAHADDVEIGCGATVAKMVAAGRRGHILDLTDASMGSRGDADTRSAEASKAARILGVEARHNAGLRDGFLVPHDHQAISRIATLLRELRPAVILVHPPVDRHPDHEAACQLVHEAAFKAGLGKFPLDGIPFRPARVFHYQGLRSGEPDFVVSVDDFWQIRRQALEAYPSQFSPQAGTATTIASQEFQDFLEARSVYLGARARCRRAEGFTCEEIPEVGDPCSLSRQLP